MTMTMTTMCFVNPIWKCAWSLVHEGVMLETSEKWVQRGRGDEIQLLYTQKVGGLANIMLEYFSIFIRRNDVRNLALIYIYSVQLKSSSSPTYSLLAGRSQVIEIEIEPTERMSDNSSMSWLQPNVLEYWTMIFSNDRKIYTWKSSM